MNFVNWERQSLDTARGSFGHVENIVGLSFHPRNVEGNLMLQDLLGYNCTIFSISVDHKY